MLQKEQQLAWMASVSEKPGALRGETLMVRIRETPESYQRLAFVIFCTRRPTSGFHPFWTHTYEEERPRRTRTCDETGCGRFLG